MAEPGDFGATAGLSNGRSVQQVGKICAALGQRDVRLDLAKVKEWSCWAPRAGNGRPGKGWGTAELGNESCGGIK